MTPSAPGVTRARASAAAHGRGDGPAVVAAPKSGRQPETSTQQQLERQRQSPDRTGARHECRRHTSSPRRQRGLPSAPRLDGVCIGRQPIYCLLRELPERSCSGPFLRSCAPAAAARPGESAPYLNDTPAPMMSSVDSGLAGNPETRRAGIDLMKEPHVEGERQMRLDEPAGAAAVVQARAAPRRPRSPSACQAPPTVAPRRFRR